MKGTFIITDAKILSIEDKVALAKDGSDIRWTEVVYLSGTDVNTVTIDKKVADELNKDEVYDLILTITEQIKGSANGRGYINHKFKITGIVEFN